MLAAAKFPDFCNDTNVNCIQELSTLFAHISYESEGLKYAADPSCAVTTDVPASCSNVSTSDDVAAWPAVAGQSYYGRGAFAITGNADYGQFSNIAWAQDAEDSAKLLTAPGDVATDGFLAFASALWVYMTPVSPSPSMHDVTVGNWKPNGEDTITATFGATTDIISGGVDCADGAATTAASPETDAAKARGANY